MSVYSGPAKWWTTGTNSGKEHVAKKGVIQSGLILNLDAGVSASYPGTGTTWTDLSGNGNHGTLVNGVSFSSSNGGIFVFDGVDDYITISLNLSASNHTIIAGARYTGTSNKRVISSNSNNWLMGWWNGQTNMYYAEGWVSASSGGVAETSWLIYAATGNVTTDSYALYRNGNLLVGPNASGSAGPNGIRIGNSGVYTTEISTCEVSFILAYNRVLTDTEIGKNFNALRGRFGI